MPKTRIDISHWMQREDDELLGYHPWDEGAAPQMRRCRMLVEGVELDGTIDAATGVVTLDTPPSQPYTGLVTWIATPVPGDES